MYYIHSKRLGALVKKIELMYCSSFVTQFRETLLTEKMLHMSYNIRHRKYYHITFFCFLSDPSGIFLGHNAVADDPLEAVKGECAFNIKAVSVISKLGELIKPENYLVTLKRAESCKVGHKPTLFKNVLF